MVILHLYFPLEWIIKGLHHAGYMRHVYSDWALIVIIRGLLRSMYQISYQLC